MKFTSRSWKPFYDLGPIETWNFSAGIKLVGGIISYCSNSWAWSKGVFLLMLPTVTHNALKNSMN